MMNYSIKMPSVAIIGVLHFLLSFSQVGAQVLGSAKITEFLASNKDGIEDAGGSNPDWIELWNSSNDAGSLDGWYLTDDPANLTKWRIPAAQLEVGEYLIIFASGDDLSDPAGELHTNFQLQSSEGGYLALVHPDGETISSEFENYPKQFEDISYGVGVGMPVEEGFFVEPTAGASNNLLVEGITEDTEFSVDRGLHESAFDLEITSATADAIIRYTTDGSPPSETEGTIYTGPINIDETTVIRAMAYRAGFEPTNIDTQSYIFLADVVTQPTMSTSITQNPTYAPQMIDSLESIPTVSLTFDGTDINRTEVPVSVELLNFESGAKQVDAGVVRYGSYVTNFQKRSIRLHFRSQYGPSRLEYPLFEETDYAIPPTGDFDSLDLRAGNHDMIHRGAYLSNRYTDDAMLDMGNLSAHGRFVHLYFNGNYRGQYHLRERWDAAMAADYLPGKEEEYDTLNTNNLGREFGNDGLQQLQDGDLTDWVAMRTLLRSSATPYSAVKEMLDVPNLIDFMLLWTMGDSESEFRAAGSIENGVGFKFFVKDADGYLRPPNDAHHSVTHNGPLSAMTEFRSEGDPDFQMVLADQIHKRFFNGGALTAESNIARLQHRIDESTLSYIAEAARWTSHNGTTNRNPAQWLAYQNNLINNHFPNLSDDRLDDLKAANMYPDIVAPVLSQHGGSIAQGAGITMTTDAFVVYYTLDGSDPRLPGGAISPSAAQAPLDGGVPTPEDFVQTGAIWKFLDDGSDQGTAWYATGFDDGSWAEGPSQLGYGESDQAQDLSFVDLDPGTPGAQRNATTYLRHKVTIPNPASFSRFDLDVLYDDGVAVYVNGVEVVRTPNLPANAAFDTYATSASPSETEFERFVLSTASFTPGENVIAVELHNERPGSSDVSFDLHLRGEIEAANGTNRTVPIILTEASQFRARAYNAGTSEWSALTSTFFSINSTPATSENLVISEIHYRPAEPTSAAELAESTDRDDFEFVELLNIGLQPIDMEGVHFSEGISYSFGAETILDPGSRAVLVKDIDAFTARYGNGVEIAGEYSGRLNNGGERLALDLEGVGLLHELEYADSSPWPNGADGDGFSLVLRDATSAPDHALPESWGRHATVGGAPGAADSVAESGFEIWKNENGILSDDEDLDRDGLSALIEYALGTSPSVANHDAIVLGEVDFEGNDFLTLNYSREVDEAELDYQIQSSTDLETWVDEDTVEVSADLYRLTKLIDDHSRHFLRLKVIVR